jgi:hypothetical protein
MRRIKEIAKERDIAWDKVWYHRCQMNMLKRYPKEKDPKKRKAYEEAEKIGKKMEKKYGKKNLSPYDDFDLGMINGRLETLNWILGDDWGNLDT